MKSLFNLDNPFMQFLARVADLILTNALFLVCCLPVVTAGASLAAMTRITQDIVYDCDAGIWRTFWKAFRENFRQATVVWLVMLVVMVSLVCDLLLIMTYFEGTFATVMYVLLAALAVLVFSVTSYLFPLLVRYENTLKQHLSNAIVLSIIKLPRTLGLLLLNLLPLIILILSAQVFVQTLVFWVIIGFGFVSYMGATLLKPVFQELEKGNQSVTVFK